MKVTRFLLSAVLLMAVAGNSYAQLDRQGGTVSLSWDVCSPVVVNKNMTVGVNTALASVLGQGIGHKAYQVWLLIGDSNRSLPEAWRFDATPAACNAGYSGGAIATGAYYNQPPDLLAKACPAFVPATVQADRIQTYQFAPAPLGFATTLGNAVAAFAYPNLGNGSPNFDPATRYHLVQFNFNHTFSVPGPGVPGQTCGGFETGMCIYAIDSKTSWLDLNNVEHLFQDGTSNRYLTYNGGALNGQCPGVIPAVPTTWGSIKAQYKH